MATKVEAKLSRELSCVVCGKPAVGAWLWDGNEVGTAGCAEHAEEVRRLVGALIADGRVRGNGKFVWLTDEGSDGS